MEICGLFRERYVRVCVLKNSELTSLEGVLLSVGEPDAIPMLWRRGRMNDYADTSVNSGEDLGTRRDDQMKLL